MMEQQLTQDQAIAIAESRVWETWTHDQIVRLQLFQDRLCMPFDRFHEAVEHVLGRPVWTHELADRQRLVDEYQKERTAPTFREILEMIPEEKRIVVTP